MKKVILVTNNLTMIESFKANGPKHGYQLLSTLNNKSTLFNDIKMLEQANNLPDIMIVTEGFDNRYQTPTWEILIKIKKAIPSLRIVYAVGPVETTDLPKMNILAQLVKADIYDILVGNQIEEETLFSVMDKPFTFEQVCSVLNYENKTSEFDPSKGYGNVILVSSIKPGSGKTFFATNLAISIAKYGQSKRLADGTLTKPKVAIVDGDLLNLSVGPMLRVDNYDKNMFTALGQIRKFVSDDGVYTATDEELANIKTFVRGCLTRRKDIDNLYCMVASDPNIRSLMDISPAHFFFLMECLIKAFDVIIVDSNSSFDHQTTAALFEMASRIYLLMDMDYNNIQNNLRYTKKLAALGYEQKLHYIINKDLPFEVQEKCFTDLDYDLSILQSEGIVIDHRIPLVDAAKMKSLDYNAQMLVLDDDKSTENARVAIHEIANDIWKIDVSKFEDNVSDVKNSRSEMIKKLSNKIKNELNN